MKKIMFNDEFGLTKAVLEGRKTMTRRIIQDKDDLYKDIRCMEFSHLNDYGDAVMRSAVGFAELQPYYRIGEVVAVAQSLQDMGYDPRDTKHKSGAIWGLDHTPAWTNKMFVSASECIHQIRITNVRVERLQDISDEESLLEGIDRVFYGKEVWFMAYGKNDSCMCAPTPKKAFAARIDKIYGKKAWDDNPWVFVYEFELVK